MKPMTGCQRWVELAGRASVDGPLSVEESAFLRNHPQQCDACAAEAAFWVSLDSESPEGRHFPPPDAAKVDAVLRAVERGGRRHQTHWARRATAALAVSAALAALTVWWVRVKAPADIPAAPSVPVAQVPPPVPMEAPREEPTPSAAPNARVELVLRGFDVRIDGQKVKAGQPLSEGQVVTAGRGGACLRIEPGIVSCLSGGGSLKVGAARREHRQLQLLRGTVVSSLAHQPEGTRFSVSTPEGTVTAVGTIFAVETNGRRVRARVHEGVVSVEPVRGPVKRLSHGDALVLGEASVTSAQALRAGDLNTVAPARLWRDTLPSSVSIETVPSGGVVSIDAVTLGRAPLEVALAPGVHAVKITAPGKAPIEERLELDADEHAVRRFVLLAPTAKPRPVPPTKTEPSAAELLDEARRLRSQEKLVEAIRIYRQLMKRYADSDEARVSRVALGDLTLASKPAEALAQYDAYLKNRGGSLELEARFGRLRALKALGRESEAQAAARAFIRDYPKSMQARTLSAELDAGQ